MLGGKVLTNFYKILKINFVLENLSNFENLIVFCRTMKGGTIQRLLKMAPLVDLDIN